MCVCVCVCVCECMCVFLCCLFCLLTKACFEKAASFHVLQQQYRDVENSLMRSTMASVNVGDHDDDGMDFFLFFVMKSQRYYKLFKNNGSHNVFALFINKF